MSEIVSRPPIPKRRTLMEIASQVGIFVGAVAVIMSGSGNRWGFVVGLAVQPFWFYTTIRHKQWGIVGASVLYSIGWSIGVYRNFFDDFWLISARIASAAF